MGKELYRTEDHYGLIVVTQRGNKRLLSFDSKLEQSSVLMDKPYYLIHQYTQIMLLGLIFTDANRITILGLGGGGLVHCLSHFCSQSAIQVIEIRQAVIDIAYDWFDLPRRENLHIINDDAFHYLQNLEPHSTDIIFSDLYDAEGMSTCQAQQEFVSASFRALSEEGCLVINFHDKPQADSELMDTIKILFTEIIIYDAQQIPFARNSIMFCCKSSVALHQPDVNWRAELLSRQVKMPLMQIYRELLFT